jgi:plastocyanin
MACSERLVERRELLELRAPHELAKQRGARDPAPKRGRLGVAPQDEPVRATDELLVGEVGELEVRLQPVVHGGSDGSFRAVLLALSTWHKIGLAGVAVVFILFALASSFLLPRYRSQFPAGRLGTFVLVTIALFVAMLVAVEIFGRESEEKAAGEAGPAAETTTAGGGAEKIQVKEREFKIELPSTSLKAGEYEFEVANGGSVPHDLVIKGPQVSNAKTPLINGGTNVALKVKLAPGTYDFYCSVPGHKQAGMDVKVKVS